MAETFNSGSNPRPHAIPEALFAGLDLFAATWLEWWSSAGGFVSVDWQGKASFGFVPYHDSPDFVSARADLPEAVRFNQEAFCDASHNGKMRSLLRLLDALPHGRDSITAHMNAHGMKCYYSSTEARAA